MEMEMERDLVFKSWIQVLALSNLSLLWYTVRMIFTS